MKYEVNQDIDTPAQWIVNGVILAGAKTAQQAILQYEEALFPVDPIKTSATADDIRMEARRRIMILLGARDPKHLDILISNGAREAIRLLRKPEANWTLEETASARKLEQIDTAIQAISTASNVLEAAPQEDYADDRHWP